MFNQGYDSEVVKSFYVDLMRGDLIGSGRRASHLSRNRVLDLFLMAELKWDFDNLPRNGELKTAFDSGDYVMARRMADSLAKFRDGWKPEVCGAAYDCYLQGNKEVRAKLKRLFPEFGFSNWDAQG